MYHINPRTGRVNICRADPRYGRCPFGGEAEHFPTKEEARGHYEGTQRTPAALSRKVLVKSSGESGRNNLYKGRVPGRRPQEGEHCDLTYFSDREADEIYEYWERPWRTDETSYPLVEAMAINFYQMAGHKSIAGALRQNEALDRKATEHLANLRKAMRRARLLNDITLFRGLKGDYAQRLANLKPGDKLEEPSFSSTTPSENGALTFAKEDGVMLQIEAKAGLNAVDLGAGLFSIDEDEILLDCRSFTVLEVQKEILDGKRITRVVVEPN